MRMRALSRALQQGIGPGLAGYLEPPVLVTGRIMQGASENEVHSLLEYIIAPAHQALPLQVFARNHQTTLPGKHVNE